MRRTPALIAILCPTLTLAASNSTLASAHGHASSKVPSDTVKIIKLNNAPTYGFSPKTIKVTKGSRVTWDNTTGTQHTATADNGKWDTGIINHHSRSKTITFKTVGTFKYSCQFHSYMHGTVVVVR